MSSLQETTKSSKRFAHMAAVRASLSAIPLLKMKNKRLLRDLKTMASINTNQSQPSNEDIDSPNSVKEEESQTYLSLKNDNSFLEKYEILEKLGQGGNGCVYKCQHKNNHHFYAVKKIKVEQDTILELKRNFISFQKLRHQAICSYMALYFDQSQRFAFLVMEYFPFPNLSEITELSQQELKSVARQLILGLEYLHKNNICHRDIKPQNILYDPKSRKIKIVDFDIAKKTFSRGARRDMLTMIGTHYYFAPQIYNGGGYNEKVDIWALGITIYKLITGCTPFESMYHSETISNILKGSVSFNQKVWGKYSSFAKDFVSRLLKKMPQRMSLAQSLKHLWIQIEEPEKLQKMKKQSSFSIDLSEQFKLEMKNFEEAISKEEGSIHLSRAFSRKIKLINVNQYDLEDPQQEQSFVQLQKIVVRSRKLTI